MTESQKPRTYVHLPTEIEAVQWLGDYNALPKSWRASGALRWDPRNKELTVITGHGEVETPYGAWIGRSKWGEFWPLHEAIFTGSYRLKEDA
jgi:hypothetical protein